MKTRQKIRSPAGVMHLMERNDWAKKTLCGKIVTTKWRETNLRIGRCRSCYEIAKQRREVGV